MFFVNKRPYSTIAKKKEYGYVSTGVHLPPQTNGNATLQNKDPFDGINESNVEDSTPESFYLRY